MIRLHEPAYRAFCKKIIILFSLMTALFVLEPGIVVAENAAPIPSETAALPEEPGAGEPAAVQGSEGDEVIVIIPDEPIPAAPAMPEQPEVSVIDKQTELPAALPQTGGIPAAALYSLGSLVSVAGILLKRRKK